MQQHPFCCFCGGHASTEEKEHIPSRQFFNDKRRPNQLVVPACKGCNRSTAPSEQIIAVLSRSMRQFSPDGLDHPRFERMIDQGLSVNNPEILTEWVSPTSRQIRRWRAVRKKTTLEVHPLNIGPQTHRHLQAFAAKLGCALWYHEYKRILPLDGGLSVSVKTNQQVLNGWKLPKEILSSLGPIKTLVDVILSKPGQKG